MRPIDRPKPLPLCIGHDRPFYERSTLEIARALLGATLIHETARGRLAGMIVETEGYVAPEDAACHAYRGVTNRNRVMFGAAGHAYVYRSYGMHYMLNVVTEAAGIAAAVLIRALDPREGLDIMMDNRGLTAPPGDSAGNGGEDGGGKKSGRRGDKSGPNVANGPGRLCQALAIGPELNGGDLTGLPLYIVPGVPHDTLPIVQTTRIGITRAVELPWRFYVKGNPAVSVRDRKAEVAN